MKKKKENGITIVSLVITIIVLLILSIISIQSLTNTGIFESANKAKLENKRGQISEWLRLELLEEQTKNLTETEEQIVTQTHKNVLDKQDELKKFGKNVKIEEVSTEKNGEEAGVYFYVIVDKDIYKVDIREQKFVGEIGKMLPEIKLVSISNTANSITVKVKTNRNEGGKLKYYIKKDSDSKYKDEPEIETTDLQYTYEGLTQGVKYSVKIVAEAPNKQTAEAVGEQTTGTIIDLKEGDLEFTSEPSTWTNTDVKVTVKANVDIKGYQLLTSQNPENGWSKATSQTFKTNGTIYAVLSDGVNYGAAASRAILNIDKKKPEVTGIETTSSTISIKAKDEDSGIVGYAITTSKVEPKEFTSVTNTKEFSTIIEEQQQGTTYYVWIKDQAGNVSEPATATMGNVTDLKQADITITPSPSGWTNGKVVATAKVNVDIGNYKIRTSTDGEHWETKNSQKFSSNGTMYVVLWDGTNYGGSASQAINNIDTTVPVVTGATATTNKITITATDETSGIVGYAVTTSNTAPSSFTDVANTKTLSVAPTGYKQGTTYYVWVKDQAGNVSASKSTATGKVTDLTSANVKFAYSPSGWTNTNVTATASTTVTGYTLQTSKDGKTWESKATQTYSSNGIIYARLWDGTNFGGTATGNFTNIDKTKPVISSVSGDSITAFQLSLSDEASGVYGYAITKTNSQPTDFTSFGSGTKGKTSVTVGVGFKTAIEYDTTYYVWIKDMAGNISDYKTYKVDKPPLLAEEVSIGDYVNYDATSNYSYTSPKGTGSTHGSGVDESKSYIVNSVNLGQIGKQKFTSSSSIKWRVLSKDTSTGEVVLISENSINTDSGKEYYLGGGIGYLYAEEELNRICSIYGHGVGANTSKSFNYVTGDTIEGTTVGTITGSGARSINVDDVNKICGVTPSTALDSKYGKAPYTKSIYYPTKSTSTGYSTSAASRTDVYTFYSYKASYYLSNTTEAYKMLFIDTADSSNIAYWLASRCVDSVSGRSSFYVRDVSSGRVYYNALGYGYSSRFSEHSNSYGVRPIVYLKSTVLTSGKDSDGAWTIIDQ